MVSQRIAAVILAAGFSKRMGEPKALLKIGTSNFHDSILSQLGTVAFDPLITVLGATAADIIKASQASEDHLFIDNPEAESGQLSSLQCALKILPDDILGCIMVLVDHPLVKTETYAKLYDKARMNPEKIIIPVYNNRGGHPVYFGRNYFSALLEAPLSKGARYVVENNAKDVLRWPVADAAVLIDIDTPKDYQAYL